MRLFPLSIFLIFVSFLLASPTIAVSDDLETARKVISAKLGVPAENIQTSPMPHLYLVSIPPRLFYASADGRYILNGDMINVATNTNITQGLRGKARMAAIDELGEASMIVFSPKNGKVKHTISVFTDIDCGYCRKLHNAIDEYNELGIRVRYLAYPRAGIGSGSYDKAVAVWCAKDRKKAMTQAKNNESVKSAKCDNPVADHFKMGTMIGVRGTPALVLESGQLVPGYVPPQRLAAILDQEAAK